MRLYFTPGTCALGCLILARSSGLAFEACRVEREQRSEPAFLGINPRGQVPAARIEEGDSTRILTENSAILLHIAGRSGSLPADGTVERDEIHYWLSWLDSGFHVAFYPFFKPQRYLPDEARHGELRDAAKEVIRGAYDVLEEHLSRRQFMMGNAPTLLDPYVFAMTRWGLKVLGGIDGWPGVQAHRERMSEQPEVVWGLGVEAGEVTTADGAFGGVVALTN